MMNVRTDRAVWVLLLVSVGLYLSLPLLSFLGSKDKVEAVEPSQFAERIHWDEDVGGITFTDCNFVMTEPNEPECKGHGVNAIYCPECYSPDYLLEIDYIDHTPSTIEFPLNINKLIPTWPDYIELEKDLMIGGEWDGKYHNGWILEKGTKVYFKD